MPKHPFTIRIFLLAMLLFISSITHAKMLDLVGCIDDSNAPLNRLTSIQYPAAPAQNITYQYDTGANAIGRLSKITDATGSSSYQYKAVASLRHMLERVHIFTKMEMLFM